MKDIELERLETDARDKMNKFHDILNIQGGKNSEINFAEEAKKLKACTPEGIAYKQAVENLRNYKTIE